MSAANIENTSFVMPPNILALGGRMPLPSLILDELPTSFELALLKDFDVPLPSFISMPKLLLPSFLSANLAFSEANLDEEDLLLESLIFVRLPRTWEDMLDDFEIELLSFIKPRLALSEPKDPAFDSEVECPINGAKPIPEAESGSATSFFRLL